MVSGRGRMLEKKQNYCLAHLLRPNVGEGKYRLGDAGPRVVDAVRYVIRSFIHSFNHSSIIQSIIHSIIHSFILKVVVVI